MIEEVLSRQVESCPACSLDHNRVLFWEHADVFGTSVHPPLIGYCPETADSISLVTDKQGREKTVAIN